MINRATQKRSVTLLGASGLAIAVWMFSVPVQPVAALAPTQTAWWNTANSSASPTSLPAPPDVDTTKHDLFVQGAAGTTGPAPTPPAPLPGPPAPPNNAQGGVQALSAIRYEIPEGAAVEKLTLQIKSGSTPTSPASPPAPTVVACALTAPTFKVEDNGPKEDIPTYDCTVQVPGTLNAAGDALEFKDIGRLAHGAVLQLVVVPGQADRVVFLHPDAASLLVSGGVPTTTSLPPFSAAGTTSAGGAGYNAPPVSAGEPPLPAPLPTAGSPSSSSSTAPVALTAPALPPASTATRLIVGLAALASIGAFAAMILLGPRTFGSQTEGATHVRGIGRFAQPRAGRPPTIS